MAKTVKKKPGSVHIEIVGFAASDKKLYGIGSIKMTSAGDVYYVFKTLGWDTHLSRHKDGNVFITSHEKRTFDFVRRGEPIRQFRGIEYLTTIGLVPEALPDLYTEYRFKKADGVFCVDISRYPRGTFNLVPVILTRKGLGKLFEAKSIFKDRQIYVYPDAKPMLGIIVGRPESPTATKVSKKKA